MLDTPMNENDFKNSYYEFYLLLAGYIAVNAEIGQFDENVSISQYTSECDVLSLSKVLIQAEEVLKIEPFPEDLIGILANRAYEKCTMKEWLSNVLIPLLNSKVEEMKLKLRTQGYGVDRDFKTISSQGTKIWLSNIKKNLNDVEGIQTSKGIAKILEFDNHFYVQQRKIHCSSAFIDKVTAERAVTQAIKHNWHAIETWLLCKPYQSRYFIEHCAKTVIGRGVDYPDMQVSERYNFVVILLRVNVEFRIITAYPVSECAGERGEIKKVYPELSQLLGAYFAAYADIGQFDEDKILKDYFEDHEIIEDARKALQQAEQILNLKRFPEIGVGSLGNTRSDVETAKQWLELISTKLRSRIQNMS